MSFIERQWNFWGKIIIISIIAITELEIPLGQQSNWKCGFEFRRDWSGDKHEIICLEMIVEKIYIRLPRKRLNDTLCGKPTLPVLSSSTF